MIITFLIGNGFDINLKLKTSYEEFYKSLEPKQITKNDIYRDIIRIKIHKELLQDKVMKNLISENVIVKKNSNDNSDEEWYTFASDYNINNNFNIDFNKTVEYLQQNNCVIKSDYTQWSDLELGIGKYLKNITQETKDKFIRDYDELLEHLSKYLSCQESSISIKESEELYTVFKNSIIKFYENLDEKYKMQLTNRFANWCDNITYNFISFNYTNILDEILSIAKEKFKVRVERNGAYKDDFSPVIHIHGTLDNNMLIGVNDKNQIDNSILREDEDIMDILIKPDCNESLANLKNSRCEDMINRSNIICLFGLSIGDSDTKWWRNIMNWLKADSNRFLVIFAYNEKINLRSPHSQLKPKRELKKKILGFLEPNDLENEELVNSIEEKIIIKFNANIFKFFEETNLDERAI